MLDKKNIEVSLLPMSQQVPASMGPVGRVDSVRNGMVKKFLAGGSGPRMRIEKRPGMTSLPTDAFANGAAIDSPANPKILSSWKDQLFLLGGSTPYVFSEADDTWTRPSNVYTTAPQVAPYRLSRAPLYSASSRAYAPDVASVGDVFCRAVADSTYGPQIIFVDKEGVQIRAPLAAAGTPTKVVSDGAVFWVYSQGATSTSIKVYDTGGVLLASSSVSWGSSRPRWDCGFQSSTGQVFLVTPTAATLSVTYSTYAAGVITSTTYTPAADVPSGVARLENAFGGNNIYVAGENVAGDVIGYEINASGVIVTMYPIASAVGFVGNIAGFVSNGSFDITVAVGVLQNTGSGPSFAAINNKTLVYTCTHAGASALSVTQRSVAPVSRAFADADGIYRVWVYYLSKACFDTVGPIEDISALECQPSFFSMNLSASVPMVDGQIELGSAYAFYAVCRNSAVFTPFSLASIAADTDGVQHVPLGTLGVQVPTLIDSPTIGFTAVTVISDYRMSPWPGEALVTSDSLMLPGFQSMSFDGSTVVESGIHLAPEVTAFTGTVGSATANEVYNYVFIWRTTDAAGNVTRSVPSPVFTVGPTADTGWTFTIATLRTTARLTVVGEAYRTFDPTGGTTEGTELRLVGTFANTIVSDTVSFTDAASDTSAAIGTSCYAQVLEDNPELDHFPPPAHSSGINFQDRSMVIGFDGAIWISSSRIEGEVPWYNPLLRIVLPSGASPIRLVPMDTRVIVMCAGGELWGFQGANLPNSTLTSGALPTPEQIPFTTGATGPAAMTPMGAVYAADRGIWMMDRAITESFIGAGVLDEVDSTSAPTGIVTNDAQRLYFLMSEDGNPSAATGLESILVYDLITGSWWIWDLPRSPAFAAIWKGRFAWVDFDDCKVWREDLPETSTYTDDGDAIITTIALSSLGFDGASGFQRLWGTEVFGEWKGPHVLAAAFTYDNAAAVSETLTMPAGVDPGEYRYEIRQEKQKNIAVEIEFSDSFSWPTLATIASSTATTMIVDDLTGLRVGSSYSTQTGGVLDSGSFEVLALSPTAKRVTFRASGWTPVATHEIIHQTDSLAPGNSFSLESVELRIGVKGGLGRLPTQRRMGT